MCNCKFENSKLFSKLPGRESPCFHAESPGFLCVCVCSAEFFFARMGGEEGGAFFSPQTVFLAQKRGFVRCFLRSPRGFLGELTFHARLEQKGEFPPC